MTKRKSLKQKILDDLNFFKEDAKEVMSNLDETHQIKTEKDVEDEFARLKSQYSHYSHEELLEQLIGAKLTLAAYKQDLQIETAKSNALLTKYAHEIQKRQAHSEKKQVKTGKFLPHTQKQEMAQAIISEMRERIGQLTPSHSKEFYRVMNAQCRRINLGEPSISTLANYFKKYTNLKSTK